MCEKIAVEQEFLKGLKRFAQHCTILFAVIRVPSVIGHSIKPSDRTTGQVGYVRLHGRRYDTWFSHHSDTPSYERYNYFYPTEELEPWVKRIQKIAHAGESMFVITNNHYEGKGIVNALQLIHLLTKRPVDIPQTLVEHYPELEPIRSTSYIRPNLIPE